MELERSADPTSFLDVAPAGLIPNIGEKLGEYFCLLIWLLSSERSIYFGPGRAVARFHIVLTSELTQPDDLSARPSFPLELSRRGSVPWLSGRIRATNESDSHTAMDLRGDAAT